jgi:hypothetical protein
VYPIRNPNAGGGTGNFIIRSRNGDNYLDVNKIFGIIGVASQIGEMVFASVNLDP